MARTARTLASEDLVIRPHALYTSAEVARFLRLQKNTLENWRSRGTHRALRFRRIGRRILYRGEDVLRFVNGATK